MSEALAMDPALDLAHALISRVLADHGIQALFVKGLVSRVQGLRAVEHRGNDVDVLCDPAQVATAVAVLDALGWERYHGPDSDVLAIGMHAIAFVIPGWPCTVDLHASFPGLLAPAHDVFAAMWDRQVVVELAHQPIPAPDRVDHAILLAVHILRDVSDADEHRHRVLFAPAWNALSPAERAGLPDAARRLGALEPIRASLAAWDIPAGPVDQRFAGELRNWNVRRDNLSSSATMWLQRVSAMPWHRRPELVFRAFWDISMDNARTPQEWAAAGPYARARGRARRLGRGVVLLPGVVRQWRSERRSADGQHGSTPVTR